MKKSSVNMQNNSNSSEKQISELKSKIKEFQNFLDALPEIVYEIRVFKPDLISSEKEMIISAI